MLDVKVTGPLARLFPSRVLVNSEEYPWLAASEYVKNDKKPDLFVCDAAMYVKRDEPGDLDGRLHAMRIDESATEFIFGAVAHSVLRDSVYILESKLKLTPSAFGELLEKLALMCTRDRPVVRGMLFGPQDFWLVECEGVVVVERTIGKWVQPGSADLIMNFFAPQSVWERVLRAACAHYEVVPVAGMAFLGFGGNGRVFRVAPSGSSVTAVTASRTTDRAMKIVLADKVRALEIEHFRMLDGNAAIIQHTGNVFHAVEDGKLLGAAVLMDLGWPVTREEARKQPELVVGALQALHISGATHGDPRLANLVRVGRALKWIDLVAAQGSVAFLVIDDMVILCRSLLGSDLPSVLHEAIETYGRDSKHDIGRIVSVLGEMISRGVA
jgi:hypothetical protein